MSRQIERYIMGYAEPPRWIRKRIMHAQKMDGSIGCELWIGGRIVRIRRGDVVEMCNGKIQVIRKQEAVKGV